MSSFGNSGITAPSASEEDKSNSSGAEEELRSNIKKRKHTEQEPTPGRPKNASLRSNQIRAESSTQLCNLNYDVFGKITSFLSPLDQLPLAASSRTLRQLVEETILRNELGAGITDEYRQRMMQRFGIDRLPNRLIALYRWKRPIACHNMGNQNHTPRVVGQLPGDDGLIASVDDFSGEKSLCIFNRDWESVAVLEHGLDDLPEDLKLLSCKVNGIVYIVLHVNHKYSDVSQIWCWTWANHHLQLHFTRDFPDGPISMALSDDGIIYHTGDPSDRNMHAFCIHGENPNHDFLVADPAPHLPHIHIDGHSQTIAVVGKFLVVASSHYKSMEALHVLKRETLQQCNHVVPMSFCDGPIKGTSADKNMILVSGEFVGHNGFRHNGLLAFEIDPESGRVVYKDCLESFDDTDDWFTGLCISGSKAYFHAIDNGSIYEYDLDSFSRIRSLAFEASMGAGATFNGLVATETELFLFLNNFCNGTSVDAQIQTYMV